MSVIMHLKCDQCGKLADAPEQHDPRVRVLPDHWRTVASPFHAMMDWDVCSPGCAKLVLNRAVDIEWEGENGAVDSLVPSVGTPQGSARLYPQGTEG